jgi:alpha-mannosidase
MNKHPTLSVYYQNHFDLVWRRCWKRSYEHLGLVYRGYADVEEAFITRALKLAVEQGAAFQLEQALSLREYLRRHPDTLPVFKRLAREGRFALLGAGEAIIDVNMCHDETMARNLASGIRYAKDTLGQAIELANHGDGFGSSAQFPQIARLCGLRGIDGLSYLAPDAAYWRGLDGSTVAVKLAKPGKSFFYDHCYYEPCLACRGHGCAVCESTGLRLTQGTYPPRGWAGDCDQAHGRYLVCSEEMMPDEKLPALVLERNAQDAEQYRWQVEAALMPLWEPALNRVDEKDVPLSTRVENNPIQTGTLVSRIRVKQAARRAEGWFYASEKLASLARLQGAPSLGKELAGAWLNLPLLFFHDAVTGTHNDAASQELLDTAEETVRLSSDVSVRAAKALYPSAGEIGVLQDDCTIAVFNPHAFRASLSIELSSTQASFAVTDRAGQSMPIHRQGADDDLPSADEMKSAVGPALWHKRGMPAPRAFRFLAENVPPLSTKVFHIRKAHKVAWTPLDGSVELGGYGLRWDDHGIQSILDRSSNQELLDAGKGPAGHLILEHDVGDPWGTRDTNRPRTSCAGMSRLIGARRTGDAAEIVFEGVLDNGTFGREKDPSTFGMQWRQTVRLLRGLPWVEFDLEIFWQSVNRRIRVVFPSRSTTDRGLYKIPCGVLRRERYEMKDNFLWAANGDWPATDFAATEPDGNTPGLAVINTGTPSVRIEDGCLMYSVLRSPGFGHCLTRYAQEYPMPTSEIRDGGHHRFRFALMPRTRDNLAGLLEAGSLLNHHAPAFRVGSDSRDWVSGISVNVPGVSVTAVKESFDGQGVVVRVVEQLGQAREVVVSLPENVERVRVTNLIEEVERELPIRDGSVCVAVNPFSIHSLLLTIRKA